ncbi:hypothetical protein CCM_06216 [Cordyceps militaris CM01]|uniref:Uncharacterized protein n=1 Tax=Cordyceps militaris (strain CM01) TaxID=983644 RepID=G3JJG8_CORMM|nr:uncharacterized protein CCM_06216 [Cordyceps militaris CM01]EGX92056.1 hypothetical protein CCM_06216 [Cordyceps militaris CM01]
MDGPGEAAIVSGPSPRWGAREEIWYAEFEFCFLFFIHLFAKAVGNPEDNRPSLNSCKRTPYNDLPSSPPPKYLPAATATIITVQAAAPPPKAARETAAAVPRAVAPEAGDRAGLALGEAGWHGRDGCDGEAGGCERCEKNGVWEMRCKSERDESANRGFYIGEIGYESTRQKRVSDQLAVVVTVRLAPETCWQRSGCRRWSSGQYAENEEGDNLINIASRELGQ